jgi:hypothetical protein
VKGLTQLPDEKEQWRWIDEHIQRPMPEIAGDEVRIIGQDETSHPEPGASDDEEGDERQADRAHASRGAAEEHKTT